MGSPKRSISNSKALNSGDGLMATQSNLSWKARDSVSSQVTSVDNFQEGNTARKGTLRPRASRMDHRKETRSPCLRCAKLQYFTGNTCENCHQPRYLDWDNQRCDFCQGNHELAECSEPDHPQACWHCGHDHLRKDCPIGELQDEAVKPFLPQFTRSKYERHRRTIWKFAKSSLAPQVVSSPEKTAGEETTVLTNFVRVDKPSQTNPRGNPDVQLFKYKIILGKLKENEKIKGSESAGSLKQGDDTAKTQQNSGTIEKARRPIDHDIRRTLIVELLRDNRPTSRFVTDYHSSIISVGELFKGRRTPKNGIILTPHKHLQGRKAVRKEMTVESKLQCEGIVPIEELLKFTRLEEVSKDFNADKVVTSVKVIVAKEMNIQPSIRANLTAPSSPPGTNICQSTKLFDPRPGMLLSVHPGHDSILLKIHTAAVGTREPQENQYDASRFVNKYFGQNRASFAKDCGLQVGQDLISLKAWTLETPKLSKSIMKSIVPKELLVISLHRVWEKVPDAKNSKAIRLAERITRSDVEVFWKSYNFHFDVQTKLAFETKDLPYSVSDSEACRSSIEENLTEAFQKSKKLNNPETVVVIILPFRDPVVYSAVKHWGDCVIGQSTSCLLKKNLMCSKKSEYPKKSEPAKKSSSPQKPDLQKMTRSMGVMNLKEAAVTFVDKPREQRLGQFLRSLSSKVNSKTGRVNYTVEKDGNRKAVTEKTMVVGAYLSRGSPPTRSSIAGVVASCDSSASTYLASARLQPGNQEYIEDLSGMIRERVTVWWDKNKSFPEEILLYRDGVSEGQFGMVKVEEVHQVQSGFREAVDRLRTPRKSSSAERKFLDPRLKTTVVAVTKHRQVRFYKPECDLATNDSNGNNPTPGLVVDSTIVNPTHFNFYLQSHATPNGTSKIAHYSVIHNDMNFSSSELQSLTNNLCYSGSQAIYRKKTNAERGELDLEQVKDGISTCTPTRFAEYLCHRVRCYIRPALYHQSQQKVVGSKALDCHAKAQELWNRYITTECRQNPWAESMDDTMFFL